MDRRNAGRAATVTVAAVLIVPAAAVAQPTGATADAGPLTPGRYQTIPTQGLQGQATALVLDTVTGRSWLLVLPTGSGTPAWIPVPYQTDLRATAGRQHFTPPD